MPRAQKKITAKERGALSDILKAAADGRLKWVDQLVRKAGYVPADEGVAQNEIVNGVPRATRAVLSAWEADGLPARKVGRRKFYDPVKLVAFVWGRYVKNGRPADEDNELRKETTRFRRLKADFQEIKLKVARGELVDVDAIEARNVSKVLALKGGLLTLPVKSAPRLVGKKRAEIRVILRDAIEELITEFAEGRHAD